MQINVNVNQITGASKILSQLMPSVIYQFVSEIGPEVVQLWQESVYSSNAKDIHKQKYIESIRDYVLGGVSPKAVIEADGMFTNIVENGMKSFSMIPGLLNRKSGSPVKYFKGGKNKGKPYRVIPFEHLTPKNSKSVAPAEFGGTKTTRTMPQELYNKMRNLKHGQTLSSKETVGGVPISELGKKTNLKTGQTGKSGTYEGITKVGRKGHTGYKTFRIVHGNSEGWQHPGFAASPVYPNVVRSAEIKSAELLAEILKDYIGGLS